MLKQMMNNEVYNKFPYSKTECLWVTYTSESGTKWYITSDIYRMTYFLWKEKKKTKHESANPLDLYKFIKC